MTIRRGARLGRLGFYTLASATLTAWPAVAEYHDEREVQLIMIDDRACTFFILHSVAQADPVVPSSPWFALPKTHPNYAELNAMLLTAKASKARVNVKTNGQIACGHGAVDTLSIL